MVAFLEDLAGRIYKTYPKLDTLTLIFPNRRAVLYFRKYLGLLLTKPAFAPKLVTIEEFISQFSELKVPDKLELVYRLHQSYHRIMRSATEGESTEPEPFDRFYFWGDMLLRDFEEADKYLVNANHLFKDLSHQKELDSSFDFLTEEQQDFLKSFWDNFDENQSLNKRKFLHIWKKLPAVYEDFKNSLKKAGLAYEGMLHREVAENISIAEGKITGRLVFAGFNALTAAEEKIISYFVENKNAEIFWDIDEYYVNNKNQEAGKFFREYQDHPILGKTFPPQIPSNLQKKKLSASDSPAIKIFGAAQPVGQAKLMAQILEEHLKTTKPEDTLIVLPDEKLLMPVLYGVSEMVEKLNVTMGFPLSGSPFFNLVELLIDLQLSCKQELFNHRQVLAVLGHPYVIAADPISSNSKRKEILRHNWVHIPSGFLASETNLHRIIFKELPKAEYANSNRVIIHYLKLITEEIGSLPGISSFDKEYAFHFLKFFNRLEEIVSKEVHISSSEQTGEPKTPRELHKLFQRSIKSFLRLVRQLMAANKIPFSGEPLAGLQIMGVLETRNIDFKNVFILSLNEGSFPAVGIKGSYIPFSIKKAYGLPTVEHQDAMYSYLFYRVLQRAENIFLFYNSETDVLGQGEMSRYLQQLLFESGIPYEKKILHNPIQPLDVTPIVVKKTKPVLDEMMKLNEGNSYFKGISPSALNMYIECRLKFYLRHIAKIKEPNEVEEELDARVLGNFLHDVMEKYYRTLNQRNGHNEIDKKDFSDWEKIIDKLIDEVFISEYKLEPGKPVAYEGQRLVVKEIVKRFAHRIIEMDKGYAPFTIEALEYGGMTYTVPISHPPYKAILSGKIDRVDKKDNVLRIIDYKTGKDKLSFETIESLFTSDSKRNKAAFQTFLYALLYKRSAGESKTSGLQLVPGLLNRLNLFDDEFSFGLKLGRDQIDDASPLLDQFEGHVQKVFDDLFNPDQPFDQTNDLENCKLCPYGQLCYR
jgi:CRISPR/Cas system-associated exonuclease Cas4 (RecB family)